MHWPTLNRRVHGAVIRYLSYDPERGVVVIRLEDALLYMREKSRHAQLILELVKVKEKENGNDRDLQRRIVDELRYLNAQV
jgi:hypothetical protein